MKETKKWVRPLLWAAGILAGAVAARWFFPVCLPFLAGFLVAWAAEPLARMLCEKGKLPRAAASGLAVTGAFVLLILGLYGLGRLALGEVDDLSRELPHLVEDMGGAASRLEAWLLNLAAKAPERFRPGLEQNIRSLFSDTSQFTSGLPGSLFSFVTSLLGSLPDAFVFLGTAVTASFLISVRLPRLRPWLRQKLPQAMADKVLPSLHNLRVNFGGWLKAQLKLMVLTFGILLAGFLFFRVPYALLLALIVALVDALPILGTGTVLVPWGIVAFLRGDTALGAGLFALYGITALSRSFLEPRLIGRQLGMNPLLTLGAVYLGYRFWGIFGMILAPVLSVTLLDLWAMGRRTAQ